MRGLWELEGYSTGMEESRGTRSTMYHKHLDSGQSFSRHKQMQIGCTPASMKPSKEPNKTEGSSAIDLSQYSGLKASDQSNG